MSFDDIFTRALDGERLSRDEMSQAVRAMMSGDVDVARIAAFLAALRVRGETQTEIVAAAQAMRDVAGRIEVATRPLIDTCGTGGSGANLFNVSSAVAVVAAAAGARVAKHGNRAVSSASGSADVLEAAGVAIDLGADGVAACIERVGVGFLFARSFHAAMKHVAPARQALATRTVFNLLGPLTNPARPEAQVIGVFAQPWAEMVARATGELGVRHALVVHSDDGLDEISIAAPTQIVEQKDGEIRRFTVRPQDFGLNEESGLDGLRAQNVADGLELFRAALGGASGAAHNMLVLNAAAALVVAGLCDDWNAGIERARDVIASGDAARKLDEWVTVSQDLARQTADAE